MNPGVGGEKSVRRGSLFLLHRHTKPDGSPLDARRIRRDTVVPITQGPEAELQYRVSLRAKQRWRRAFIKLRMMYRFRHEEVSAKLFGSKGDVDDTGPVEGVLEPLSLPLRVFEVLLMSFTVYNMIVVPLRIGFSLGTRTQFFRWPVGAIDYFTDLGFFLEVWVGLRLAFFDKGDYVRNLYQIRQRYIAGKMPWDLASCLPFDLIPYCFGRHDIAAWLRLTRLLRTARVPRFFDAWEKTVTLNFMAVRLTKMSFWILMIAHWIGCVWFFIGFYERRRQLTSWVTVDLIASNALGPAHEYVRSLYWAVTVLGTIGFGDIVPVTIGETLWAILVMLVGQSIYAFIIGNISSVLQANDTLDTEFRKKMASLRAYIDWRELPPRLKDRIISYFEYTWQSNKGIDEERILAELPSSLRNEIAMHLNAKMVHRVPIFRNCDVDFIRKLVSRIRSTVVIPGDYVVRNDDVGRNMYLIARGELAVESDGKVIAHLRAGSYFGEIALLKMIRRTASVKAITYCELFVLSRTDFDEILNDYPAYREKMLLVAEARETALKAVSAQGAGAGANAGANAGAGSLTPIQKLRALTFDPSSRVEDEQDQAAKDSHSPPGGGGGGGGGGGRRSPAPGRRSPTLDSGRQDSVDLARDAPIMPRAEFNLGGFASASSPRGNVAGVEDLESVSPRAPAPIVSDSVGGSVASLASTRRSRSSTVAQQPSPVPGPSLPHPPAAGGAGLRVPGAGTAPMPRRKTTVSKLVPKEDILETAEEVLSSDVDQLDQKRNLSGSEGSDSEDDQGRGGKEEAPLGDRDLPVTKEDLVGAYLNAGAADLNPRPGQGVSATPRKTSSASSTFSEPLLPKADPPPLKSLSGSQPKLVIAPLPSLLPAASASASAPQPSSPHAVLELPVAPAPQAPPRAAVDHSLSPAAMAMLVGHGSPSLAATAGAAAAAAAAPSHSHSHSHSPAKAERPQSALSSVSAARWKAATQKISAGRALMVEGEVHRKFGDTRSTVARAAPLVSNDSRFAINPGGIFYRYWDLAIFFVTLYDAVTVPFRIAFETFPRGLYISDYVTDALLVIDVVLQFFVAFRHEGLLVRSLREIRLHYVKGLFALDLLSALPFDVIPLALGERVLSAWLRLTRLGRLLKVKHKFDNWGKSFVRFNANILRVFKLTFWLLVLTHWVGCAWFWIGMYETRRLPAGTPTWVVVEFQPSLSGSSIYRRWLRSVYFATTTLATVGFGDIVPRTSFETSFVLLVMIVGQTLYAYIIANMSSVVTNADALGTHFQKMVERVTAYARWRQLPAGIHAKITSYYEYLWATNKGIDEKEVLLHLSSSVREDVSLYLNRGLLARIPIFRACKDMNFITRIVTNLQSHIAGPGDYVIRQGDVGREMYLLSRGTVEVVSGQTVVATLHGPTFFGETALLTAERRNASIRASTYCELFILHKEDFDNIMNDYADYRAEMEKVSAQRQARTAQGKK